MLTLASDVNWERLHEVARDLRYLLNRGYHKTPALNFLANRWQLTALEREILTRAVFSQKEILTRRRRKILVKELRGRHLAIDGHNVLITVESALKGLPVFLCDDGFVRDASKMSGRFRPNLDTQRALKALVEALKRLPLKGGQIYFDAPISRSGDLAALCRKMIQQTGLLFSCETVSSADRALQGAPLLASSDAALIEQAEEVFDLGAYVLRKLHLKPPRL